MRKNSIWILMLIFFSQINIVHSQTQRETSETEYYTLKVTPINLIDNPTANFISRKHFQLKLRMYHMGGMLTGLTVGLTQRLMFGVTYGGQNIIGQGKVNWNESPGVHLRYRMKFEDYRIPAISIGFNSQGFGTYYPKLNRYQIKSKGFYVVVSKNYFLLKDFGIHGGINYSGENHNSEKDMNFFCGAHLMLDPELTLLWEYDFGINDNDERSIGSGKGYMNVAVRWFFSRRLLLEFSVKNILRNNRTIEGFEGEVVPQSNRELKIIYLQNL